MIDRLILASKSPYRSALLKNAGLIFTTKSASIDERSIENGLKNKKPIIIAQVLSEEKARNVSFEEHDALVIGCDQTLDLDGKVLHKSPTLEDARQKLAHLSGKSHFLHSGIALAKNGEIIWSDVVSAQLTMRSLSMDYIGRYLNRNGETVLDSVGAYQIEGNGIQLFEKIEGDHFTIIGLPLLSLLAQLRHMGVIDG